MLVISIFVKIDSAALLYWKLEIKFTDLDIHIYSKTIRRSLVKKIIECRCIEKHK